MITTARQLKDLIRNLSKKKSADAQILMRNYMMERFLERISLSEYKNQFILKGGMPELLWIWMLPLRDFYDIYILQKLYGEQLSKDVLWDALVATAKKRETLEQIETEDIDEVFDEIQSSSVMENLWKAYQRNYSYSADIPWHTIMKSIRTLYEIISENIHGV